jgi:hypothetical protein
VDVRDEDWDLLKETERRGYIQIRMKDESDTDKTLG